MRTVDKPRHAGPPSPAPGPARRRGLGGTVIILLLLAAGVVTLLYPVAATTWNDYRQRVIAQQFADSITAADPSALSAEFDRARAYNETLDGAPILDPYIDNVQTTQTAPYREYLGQLSNSGLMGRVRVPSVGIDVPLRHGTGPDVIATGAGHLYGTALPVGGDGTHAVLTSHSGMPNATLFDRLVDVAEGDLMLVDAAGRTVAYRVDDIRAVLPGEVSSLSAVPGQDLLTLFTCTPYAVNTHRLLVTGHAVPYDTAVEEEARRSAPRLQVPRHMVPLLAGAAAGLALMVFIIVSEARAMARRRDTASTAAAVEADAQQAGDADGTGEPRPRRAIV